MCSDQHKRDYPVYLYEFRYRCETERQVAHGLGTAPNNELLTTVYEPTAQESVLMRPHLDCPVP